MLLNHHFSSVGFPHSVQRRKKTYCFEYVYCLCAEPRRVKNLFIEDGLKEIVFIFSLKGGVSREHLIQQHPQGPPIHRGSVQHLLENLWGHFKAQWSKVPKHRTVCVCVGWGHVCHEQERSLSSIHTHPFLVRKNARTQEALIPHYKNQPCLLREEGRGLSSQQCHLKLDLTRMLPSHRPGGSLGDSPNHRLCR